MTIKKKLERPSAGLLLCRFLLQLLLGLSGLIQWYKRRILSDSKTIVFILLGRIFLYMIAG